MSRPITVTPGSSNIGSTAGNQCTCQGGAKECYMADPTTCNGFFVCTNGNKFKKTCPGVLRWSTIKNHCEWPNSVQCGARPVTASATPGGARTCNCPAGKSECFYEGNLADTILNKASTLQLRAVAKALRPKD